MKIHRLRASSALGSVAFLGSLMAASAPAFAQTAPTTAPVGADQATPATLPADTPQADEDKAIIVTGSRIKQTTNFNSSSPIAIIDPEIAEKRGIFDTAELLQSNPIASGSSQVTSAISSNFVTDGGPGASTISLRGLGANRTLVLLNGRRAGPAGTRGAVSAFDLNVLPESIIKQVQIVKDGASSVYGSDAVAGVVNILTKTKTKGLELTANGSAAQKEGGDQYRFSGAWGKEWGGSSGGHILLAGDYYHQAELARRQRSYLNCPEDYVTDKSGARIDLVNPVTGQRRCNELSWGQVYVYDYSYLYGVPSNTTRRAPQRSITRIGYSYPGENLGRYVPPITASNPYQLNAPGFYGMGYDQASSSIDHLYNPIYGDASVIPETTRLTFYGDGSQHIGDHVEVYAEGLWNRRETRSNAFRQFWDYGYTGNFDGAGFGDPRVTNISGAYIISPTPITDHFDSSQKVDYYRGVGGVRGDFGNFIKGWSYDGFVQYSHSSGAYTQDQIYKDSVDQQTYDNGVSGSYRSSLCAGQFSSVRHASCVDINWADPQFLAGNLTAAQRNYLFGVDTGHTTYTQLDAELSVTGTIFNLPAGPLGGAFGIAWRKDSIYDRPGDITYALKFGADPTLPSSYIDNAWGVTSSGITAGKTITEEAFGEISVPLIHNTPFIKDLSLSASGRITQFKATRLSDGKSASDNGNWTYKAGAVWQVNNWLRFRGTYGTSYRAPALFEQFLADQSSFIGQRNIDPCIRYDTSGVSQTVQQNCAADGVPAGYTGGAATATVTSGGGLGVVHAETSNARTASIILTPKFSFLPGTHINLAVDYFRIEVDGEISQLGAANIVNGCYTSTFFPNDPLCKLFTRQKTAPVNAISLVRDSFINIDKQVNEGVDVTANVDHDFGNWGKVALTAEMTWQIKDTTALFNTTQQDFNGRAGEPVWTGNFNLLYNKDSFSFYYGLNVIGGTDDSDYFKSLVANNGSLCPPVPAGYTTASAAYGSYCELLRARPTFYHSASVTKRFSGLEVTMGVTNLFNTAPPRVSVFGDSVISTLGQSVFSSQYDLIGRRGFLSVKTHF